MHKVASKQRKWAIIGTRHQFTFHRERLSEAGATWLLLERLSTGKGQETIYSVCGVFVKLDLKHISWCFVQFPQPRVSGDGWDHGSHGSNQSVLQSCGPESSTSRSWTRSVFFHKYTATPLPSYDQTSVTKWMEMPIKKKNQISPFRPFWSNYSG